MEDQNPNSDMDMKKKIIAFAALPLSVGFLVWRLQSNTQAAPPPPAPTPAASTAAPAPATDALVQSGPVKVVAVPVSGKDPFVPAFDTGPPAKTAEASAPAKAPARGERIASVAPLSMPPLPPLSVESGGLQPFGPSEGIQLPPRQAEPAAAAEPVAPPKPVVPYLLTGVIKGSPDLAILRHSDGGRLIVRAGDMIDETFRLVSVDENSARLSSKNKNHTLHVGGEAMPQSRSMTGASTLQAKLAGAFVALKH